MAINAIFKLWVGGGGIIYILNCIIFNDKIECWHVFRKVLSLDTKWEVIQSNNEGDPQSNDCLTVKTLKTNFLKIPLNKASFSPPNHPLH